MGIDWEELLDCDGDDLDDAYQDLVYDAYDDYDHEGEYEKKMKRKAEFIKPAESKDGQYVIVGKSQFNDDKIYIQSANAKQKRPWTKFINYAARYATKEEAERLASIQRKIPAHVEKMNEDGKSSSIISHDHAKQEKEMGLEEAMGILEALVNGMNPTGNGPLGDSDVCKDQRVSKALRLLLENLRNRSADKS